MIISREHIYTHPQKDTYAPDFDQPISIWSGLPLLKRIRRIFLLLLKSRAQGASFGVGTFLILKAAKEQVKPRGKPTNCGELFPETIPYAGNCFLRPGNGQLWAAGRFSGSVSSAPFIPLVAGHCSTPHPMVKPSKWHWFSLGFPLKPTKGGFRTPKRRTNVRSPG